MAVLLLTPVLFFSCRSGDGSPKAVMMQFFEALSKKDIAEARKLSTSDSKLMIDFLENILSKTDNKEAEKFNKANLEIGEAKIDGDKASIPVTEKTTNETLNYMLKKENGTWKMSFDEESIMNMGVQKMDEKGIDPARLEEQLKDMNMDSLRDELKKGKEMFDSIKKEADKVKTN